MRGVKGKRGRALLLLPFLLPPPVRGGGPGWGVRDAARDAPHPNPPPLTGGGDRRLPAIDRLRLGLLDYPPGRRRLAMAEATLHYLCQPTAKRAVDLPVEFMPVQQFL